MPPELLALIEELMNVKGCVGVMAAGVFLAVRIARLPEIQARLPTWLKWEGFSLAKKWLVLAAVSGLGASLAALQQHMSIGAIVSAGVTAMATAMLAHEITDNPTARAVVQLIVPPAKGPPA